MRRILIAAGALTLLAPSLSLAQPAPNDQKPVPRMGSPRKAERAVAPTVAPIPRTGAPVNPRVSAPVTARAVPGVNTSATVFTYRGVTHPAISAPTFVYPSGWAYRHWIIGQSLPLLFLAGPYWFDDYAVVDIPPPPPGFRWVRYGPDLLLVNIRTGRIAQVIYGVFY